MATFLEDPRLRQRWNQLSHTTEAVTENAAARIWTLQHNYLGPCFGAVGRGLEPCTAVCFGDREDRARRQRERERGARRGRAEYSFDFYDDWEDADDEFEGGGGGGGSASSGGPGGLLGSWGSEDWDRLLAGTGSSRSRLSDGAGGPGGAAAVSEQPRRKRAMSYGTRGRRKKPAEDDPTIIPSTAPLGFLGRLPWKVGGTLRYKPSAANLRDHPGGGTTAPGDEHEQQPLLGTSDDEEYRPGLLSDRQQQPPSRSRKRSGTATSGESTTDSYRSRGDLFPSDGEGDEDAVPLDDEFAVALDRVDDRSSGKTRSSKGKRPEGSKMSRTVSRTTVASSKSSRPSIHGRDSSTSIQSLGRRVSAGAGALEPARMADLQHEEEQLRKAEDEEIERKRRAAAQLAMERGLNRDDDFGGAVSEDKTEMVQVEEIPEPTTAEEDGSGGAGDDAHNYGNPHDDRPPRHPSLEALDDDFIPARLPNFR